MTLRALMESWLSDPDPVKRAHAARRLARPDMTGDYPPLAEQAGNALSAAGRVVAAVAAGRPVAVPDAERARRLAVCTGTPDAPRCDRYDPDAGRCTACGCVAAWKAALATEHCPLEKW